MAERKAEEIRQAELKITIQKIKRRGQLEIFEDYFTFVSSKVAGLGLSAVGILETLSPDIITAVIPEPAGVLGIGAAILVGKKAAQLIAKLAK